MEAESVSDGENNRKRDAADDYNDNNNGSNKKIANSSEGQSKPKRQMKTPFQLEALEKAYSLETYPSEAMRAELSQKLGLSDRQLQMWFCHRRLKDKKEMPKPSRKAPPPLSASPTDELRMETELANDYGSGSGSGSSPFTRSELRNVVPRGVPGYYESQQALMELRAIACVEAQLGEPLREDGPILGIEFDPLPPDAFGAPIAVTEQQKRPNLGFDSKVYERHDVRSNKAMARTFHEYPFIPNHSSIRSDAYGQLTQSHLLDPMDGPARTPSFVVKNEQLPRIHAAPGHSSRVRVSSLQDKQGLPFPSPPREDDGPSQRESYTNLNIGINSHFTDHPIVGPENPYAVAGGQIFHGDAIVRVDRKRKSDDSRTAREAEAHEMRIQKEIEKQDTIRRKNEERMRKEMERQDRERRKEEERLIRERQREEERTKREQRREIERREKFLMKENLRAEKRRQKEELRKEKEAERRKAALEKAVARRIAKESMELIEDEQLELMELAVASKGLPSIINLDLDTLQNLDMFRDSLCIFPPKGVKLKKPFAVQPWIKSEEHVGNLLMVWRFLITFADVLELWPFTLDEFLQAFHDYDSRLFGEIHVALLKLIIKDIEDVARTPTGLGTNQNGAANPAGGHPEIVEGAYAWGFDIRNWQKHLNQSTWPEIFRQLALSAGFGPRLKKRNIPWPYANDKDEQGRSCEDIISTLRNGSAAENAVAKMQEKGLLAPRRNRHRLTPGTVKFAAFHVLSLEGGKGLTVLELAEKIQKSGLRDLTTSKTPEASISVALTRDAKLFERIAPSTYRVRAAYRKDPADAEAILSDARKKIQIFENGFPAVEDADDVEREEESESDEVDEDPEVDDLVNPLSDNKTTEQYDDLNNCSTNGRENLSHDMELVQNEFGKDLSCVPENCSKDTECPGVISGQRVAEDLNMGNPEENMEIDESKSGESWVQGLTEGEYSDLSVEERLNALVALVGVANEGNSIRLVLEDRLEAANALKKQMWAEAQIDKVRQKDDNPNKSDFPSVTPNKVDAQYTGPAAEGNQSPLLDININNNEASPSTAENQKEVLGAQNTPIEKPSVVQDLFIGPDNLQILSANASKRSRSQLKSYIAHIAEEMYVYRSLPLGQDRRRNRYWQFVASASSSDPGAGRVFIELHDGSWKLIDSEEDFDALLTSLDSRGIRESHLRLMLQKIENSFKENVRKNSQFNNIATESIKNEADEVDLVPECRAGSDSSGSTLCGLNSDSTLETSSSFKIQLGRSESEKKAALTKYQDVQKWIWKECYNSLALYSMKYGQRRCKSLLEVCDMCFNPYFFEDSHCNSCHHTFATNNGFNFSKHAFQCGEKLDSKGICSWDSSLPLRIRLLKALLACIEASVPLEALQSIWTEETRKQWGVKLSKSSTTDELLQLLTLLERAVQRDFLSSNFSTTEEMLGSSCMPDDAVSTSTDTESVPVLPWVPKTTAAVSLRIFEFDASISYIPVEKPELTCEEKEVREYVKLPSRYAPFKSGRANESAELDHDEFIKEDKSNRSFRSSNKRGRGSHDQGRAKKLARRMPEPKQHAGRRSVRGGENLGQGLKQQGRGSQGQPGGRGRRTVRKRRVEKRAVEDLLLGHKGVSRGHKIGRESLRSLEEEWDGEKESSPIQMDVVDNSNSADEVESDDNGQAVEYDEQGNWEVGFNGDSSNRWDRDLVGVSDEEVVGASEDDNGIEEGEEELEEDSEEEVMSEGEDSDAVGNNRMMVNEEGSDSAVSEDSSD